MEQIRLGLDALPKRTRKAVFHDEMNQVLRRDVVAALIQWHARGAQQLLSTINTGLGQQVLMRKTGTVVDTRMIAAPGWTNNHEGERDPEMVSGAGAQGRAKKNGGQWHFGMKAHIGVDAESGLVHTVMGTATNVNGVTQAGAPLHGQETWAIGQASYRGVDGRPEAQGPVWYAAMQPGKRKALDPTKK